METAPGEDPTLTPGCFAIYNDGGGGEHCAILLELTPAGHHWLAVFLTSNTRWTTAPILRATQEDLAAGGYVSSRVTYLAPVVRQAQFFRPMSQDDAAPPLSVSPERVAALLRFFRPYFGQQ